MSTINQPLFRVAVDPCRCGSKPKFKRKHVNGVYTLQLVCDCGNHGAVIMFTKREQAPQCKQAAADGWNLGQ